MALSERHSIHPPSHPSIQASIQPATIPSIQASIPAYLNEYKWLETFGERCYSANNERKLHDSKRKKESLTFKPTESYSLQIVHKTCM